MKKTVQKTLNLGLKAILLTSAMVWATGQASTAQNTTAVKSTDQNSVKQATANNPHSRAVQLGTPPKHDAKGVVTTDKKKQAQSKEQLMFQRKQAAQKGQPVKEYDNAIKQLNTNQAK